MTSLCLVTPGTKDQSNEDHRDTPVSSHPYFESAWPGSSISTLVDAWRLKTDHRPLEMTLIGLCLLQSTLKFPQAASGRKRHPSRPSSSHSGMPEVWVTKPWGLEDGISLHELTVLPWTPTSAWGILRGPRHFINSLLEEEKSASSSEGWPHPGRVWPEHRASPLPSLRWVGWFWSLPALTVCNPEWPWFLLQNGIAHTHRLQGGLNNL